MPPAFRPEDTVNASLHEESQKILGRHELETTEIPLHQAVIARADTIIREYGRRPNPPNDDRDEHGGILRTPWIENASLADGGARVFYRLQKGHLVANSTGTALLHDPPFTLLAKVTVPGPLPGTKELRKIIEVGVLEPRRGIVQHELMGAELSAPGVYKPKPDGLDARTSFIALKSESDDFKTIVDTMDYIAEAASHRSSRDAE